MAKKAAKTGLSSSETSGPGAAAASKKSTASRTQKHLKAQASGVVAAVEGFVSAITNTPAASEDFAAAALPEEKAPETKAPEIAMAAAASSSESVAKPAAKEVTHQEIAALAYTFYLNRGAEGGSQAEDWFRAEQTLKAH